MRIPRVVAAVATVIALMVGFAVPAQAATTVSITVKIKDNWTALTKGCVTVHSSSKTAKDCTVNSSGAFTFAGLPKATYTISASGFPNHYDAVLPSKATFATATAFSTTGTLKRYTYVHGLVKSGVGEPIPGVIVTAVPHGPGSTKYSPVSVVTSSTGNYSAYLPGSITWNLVVGPSDVYGTYPQPGAALNLVASAPNEVRTYNITVPRAGSVAGTLVAPPGVTASQICASLHSFIAGQLVAADCGAPGDQFLIQPITPGTYYMCVGASPAPATCIADVAGVREVLGTKAQLNSSDTAPGRVTVTSMNETAVDVTWGGTLNVTVYLDNGAKATGGCVQAVSEARGLDVTACDPVNGVYTLSVPMDLENGVVTTFSLDGSSNAADATWNTAVAISKGATWAEGVGLASYGTGSITFDIDRADHAPFTDGCAYLLLNSTSQKVVASECDLNQPLVFDGLAEGDYALKVTGVADSFTTVWYGGTIGPVSNATWVHLADAQAKTLAVVVPSTQVASGTVKDGSGNSLSGGFVELVGSNGQVLASTPVVAGAYTLTAPIEVGLLRAVGFAGFGDVFIGNRYLYTSWANTTGPDTSAQALGGQNFTLLPSAALTGVIAAPGYLSDGDICVQVSQAGYGAYGPSTCGSQGDPFSIPVPAGASYYVCVKAEDWTGPCASSSTGSDIVGSSFSPVAFSVPPAGGNTPITYTFGGTYHFTVSPSGSSDVLLDGCVDVTSGGVVVGHGCAGDDGIATVVLAEDHDPYDLGVRTLGYRGAYDGGSSQISAAGISNGAVVSQNLTARSWPIITGTITRPAEASNTHACVFATNLVDAFEELCLEPGTSTYTLRALPGKYYLGFYTEEPGVAYEWFDNKPTLAGATLVTVSDGAVTHASAVLEASGRISGTVTGPGGAPGTGGCVEAYDSNDDLAQGDCVDAAGSYALESLPVGDYTIRFTGFDGLSSKWYPAGAAMSGATTVGVVSGATTTVDASLEAGAQLSGEVTLAGATATGGCVALYTPGGEFYESACVDGTGTYAFDDILPGSYHVWARGFSGAADTWVGGTYTVAGPMITAAVGDPLVLDIGLAPGGSVSGSIDMGTTGSGLRTIVLVDMNGVEMDRVVGHDVNPTDYDNRDEWTFENIPAGTYKLRFIKNGATQWQWHVAGGELAPAKIVLSSANALTVANVTIGTYTAGGRRSLWGSLNVPSSWKSSTVCALALNSSGYVLAADCGKRGGEFLVASLGGFGYALVFTNGEVRTQAQYKAFKGSKKWYGSGPPLYYTMGTGGASYFPVWFYPDVTYKTPNFEAVQWMGDQGLFTGYSDGSFKPANTLTRRDFAVYLYRLAGSPAVALPAASPFADVSKTDPAYKALLWMRSQSLWTSATYKPTSALDRRTEALLLYRFAGSPAVTLPAKSPFTDVSKTDYAYKAILWANKYKIVPKATTTTFAPSNIVKRSSGAAALYEWWWRYG